MTTFENYEPKGIRFIGRRGNKIEEMILVQDPRSSFDGWICYRHPDGQWVSLRPASETEKQQMQIILGFVHAPPTEPIEPKRESLGEIWADYERSILDPINAPPTQRQETRRAFYAGAGAMLHALIEGLDPDKEPTVRDLEYVTSLDAECKAFIRDVMSGTA